MASEQTDRTHRIGDEVLQRVINKCEQRIGRGLGGVGGFNPESYGDFGLSLLEWRELLGELQQRRARSTVRIDMLPQALIVRCDNARDEGVKVAVLHALQEHARYFP